MNKVAMDRFFSVYFGIPLPASFHQCSILIFHSTTTDDNSLSHGAAAQRGHGILIFDEVS